MTIQPGHHPSPPPIPIPIPTVEARVSASTEIWARDLRSLFEHAKARFGDVSWESEEGGERIWAHKAVIYARAPKAFKERYFISRPFSRSPTSLRSPSPNPFTSPLPSPSPHQHLLPPLFPNRPVSPPSAYRPPQNQNHSYRYGTESSLSAGSFASEGTVRAGTATATATGGDGVLRLTHGDTPELFQAQLEWLYTGEGFGDVVEWISSEGELGDGESVRDSLGRRGDIHERRDKLGQDLTYMWRSKLYADVRIHLAPPEDVVLDINKATDKAEAEAGDDSDSSTDSLSSTAIFPSHRFILASRSPYFASVLLNPSDFKPSTADIHLSTPPFTPAALHFCLGYIYAGHLDFSNRTFDLTTAFQIHKAAAYLQLDSLIDEVESRIVHDFCHGLDWNKCHCRKCSLRVGRVWRFASEPVVGAVQLARQGRVFLVRGWGEAWGKEVGLLDREDQDDLVKEVCETISPRAAISAYRSIRVIKARIEQALRVRGREAASWVGGLETMIEAVEVHARNLLIEQFAEVAESVELWNLVSGKGFELDLLELIGKEVVEGVGTARGCIEAPKVYQSLVSSILLKVDPDTLQAALPARSQSRQEIEAVRQGVLGHMRKRWMQIRDMSGFAGLEHWSLKEISDEIEVPIDELVGPSSIAPFIRSRLGGPSMPRTTSRVMSLSDAGSVRSSASTSRLSTASRPFQSVDERPVTPEANGLRRLRLSTSASTASLAASPRSTSAPPPTLAQVVVVGPSARSPTAARQSTTATVGTRARAAARAGAASPSPSVSSVRPIPSQGRQMSGPPRQLMTRATPSGISATASDRPPSIASVRPTRTTATASTSSQRPVPPLGPINPPIKPADTVRTPVAGPSRSKTPTPSMSSTRSRNPLPTTSKTPVGNTARVTPPVRSSSPTRSVASTRIRTLATATTASTRAKAGPSDNRAISSAASRHSRTPSVATTISVRSKPPPLPTKSPPATKPPLPTKSPSSAKLVSDQAAARSRTASGTTMASTKSTPPAKSTPLIRTSASTSTLRTPCAAGARSIKSPPTTTGSSSSAASGKSSTTASLKPSTLVKGKTPPTAPDSSARLRQASSLSARTPLARATRINEPSNSAIPSSKASVRSPSGSTDNAPEPRTPRLSEISNIDQVHIRQEGSESSSVDFPPFPSSFPKHSAFPPISMPRPVRQGSTASTHSNASVRLHPASAFDPPKREPVINRKVSLPKLHIEDGSVPFTGLGIELRIGVPCIVSLERKRARFRAVVRYIGLMKDATGPWVGIEVDDLARFGVSTLPNGSKDGIHYFHLTQKTESPMLNGEKEHNGTVRSARQRKVEVIRESLAGNGTGRSRFGSPMGFATPRGQGQYPDGLGLGLAMALGGRGGSDRGIRRSVSPLVMGMDLVGGFEQPRALFVRPSEVVFVLGAE